MSESYRDVLMSEHVERDRKEGRLLRAVWFFHKIAVISGALSASCVTNASQDSSSPSFIFVVRQLERKSKKAKIVRETASLHNPVPPLETMFWLSPQCLSRFVLLAIDSFVVAIFTGRSLNVRYFFSQITSHSVTSVECNPSTSVYHFFEVYIINGPDTLPGSSAKGVFWLTIGNSDPIPRPGSAQVKIDVNAEPPWDPDPLADKYF
uniref:ApaG domain-containing protein n=1 Tax=Ascaris lumbricoides TaxID=6252 RepID=A0A0M3HPP4_ASCLU